MNKIHCADKLKEILPSFEDSTDLFFIERECLDSWDENGGCFLVYLVEEDYRDYDAIKEDIIAELVEALGPEITVLYGMNNKYPDNGYVLNIHRKTGGLCLEIELYRLKNGKTIPRID